ncbi:DUF3828 domain-containing protein [Bosea beijingensis]|uniref:DUF3828 domain-containing protein n=1 Tax=Bosea beijingensis TaxID=3068632 RepID=UPI002740F13D|nr:DUF3828 domain-containing protein [Bosea sp. REN20]
MSFSRLAGPAALALLLAAATAQAGDKTPAGTVMDAYAVTRKTLASSGEPPWRPPHRDKLMSKSLAALFARDDLYQDEAGEIGHIGADPFISGQDGEVKFLKVTVAGPPENGRALVNASFRSFKQPVTVRFRMIQEGGGWRIDDIVNRVEGKDYSVREELSKSYDCGSFMNKPCKR